MIYIMLKNTHKNVAFLIICLQWEKIVFPSSNTYETN